MLLGHLQWRILEVLWAAGHPASPDHPVTPVSVPALLEALSSHARPVARTSINAAVSTLAAADNPSRGPLVAITREGRPLGVTALKSRFDVERDVAEFMLEHYFKGEIPRALRAMTATKFCPDALQTELLVLLETQP